MIADPDFAFLFRLAFALKKSVQEVLALPAWEREIWKSAFDLFGPLDWKRDDYWNARLCQFLSTGSTALDGFLLFPDPTLEREPTAAALWSGLGLSFDETTLEVCKK